MKFFKKLSFRVKILLAFLGSVFLWTRLVYLNSGVNFAEPDEWSYDIASKSLSEKLLPEVAGRPLLEQTPIFEYIGYFINFLIADQEFPRTFISIRLISVISSFVLAVALFYYLAKKENVRVGVLSLILFTFTPITLFYSKLGLREMLLITVIFLFFVVYERFLQSSFNFKLACLSGVLLGFAVAVKNTALVFLPIPFLFLTLSLFEKVVLEKGKNEETRFSFKLSKKWTKSLTVNGVVLLLGVLIPSLLLLPNFLSNPTLFKDRIFLTLFSHNLDGGLQKLKTLVYYFNHLEFWLSIGVILLLAIGILRVLVRREFKWTLAVIFMLPIIFFLTSNEPRGRYFVLLSPFIIIFASLGFDFLLGLKFSRNLFVRGVLISAVILSILPSSRVALESTNHTVLEQSVKLIREDPKGGLIFSSFWPPIVQYSSGIPTARLTDTRSDSDRDHNELPKFSPRVDAVPTEYILKYSSSVLILEPLDKDEFAERKRAVEFVKGNFRNYQVITDMKPNFPEKTPPYKIYVFKVDNINQLNNNRDSK